MAEMANVQANATSRRNSTKAAEDSRTPRRCRDRLWATPSARSWSAAVLCRFDLRSPAISDSGRCDKARKNRGRGGDIGSRGSLMAGPGIGFENLIERGMGDNLVLVHRAANALGNLRKVDAAVDEGFNGDFVGGIEYGGKGTADFARFARELER